MVAELGQEAVVEARDDGSVVVGLSVTDIEACVLWVLDLLDHAEVLEPPTVRSAVIDHLTAVAAGSTGPAGTTGGESEHRKAEPKEGSPR